MSKRKSSFVEDSDRVTKLFRWNEESDDHLTLDRKEPEHSSSSSEELGLVTKLFRWNEESDYLSFGLDRPGRDGRSLDDSETRKINGLIDSEKTALIEKLSGMMTGTEKSDPEISRRINKAVQEIERNVSRGSIEHENEEDDRSSRRLSDLKVDLMAGINANRSKSKSVSTVGTPRERIFLSENEEQTRKDRLVAGNVFYPRANDRLAVINALYENGQHPLNPTEFEKIAMNKIQMFPRRVEEDEFLRTALHSRGERSCGRRDKCEAFKIWGHCPVECPLIDEHRFGEDGSIVKDSPSPCLLCRRYDAQYNFLAMRMSGKKTTSAIITTVRNSVEELGEYRIQQCIYGPEYGLPVPVVAFVASDMDFCEDSMEGERIHRWKQTGLDKPTNRQYFP